MKKTLFRSVVACLVLALGAGLVFAGTYNAKLPFNRRQLFPCMNEYVNLSGTLHVVIKSELKNGKWHVVSHHQPQGVTGLTEKTKKKYNATGITRYNQTVSASGGTFNYVNRYHMVGTAGAKSFYVKQNFKITVNAKGVATASLGTSTKTTCQ